MSETRWQIEHARSPAEVIDLAAQHYAARDALHIPHTACAAYSPSAITRSYRELWDSVNVAAAAWAGVGLRGRVALVLENRVEFFVHWLALNRLGNSVIPINHELGDSEISYCLEHGEAVAMLTLTSHQERCEQLARSLASGPIPCLSLEHPWDGGFGPALEAIEPDPQRECALLYTSGSTGQPKGCQLSNDYFVCQGLWYRRLGGYIALREGVERLLTPLPLSHMNAMAVSSMAMFMTGGCLVQLDRFHPASWWQSVRESEATALHYLGVLPAILLAMPESEKDDFSDQVRFGFGAGVNPAHHADFESRFGFPLIEAWAMTECGAGGAIIANEEPRHVGTCCFGKPSTVTEWQIIDEQGQAVPSGEPGELRVRAAGDDPAHGFFSGYLNHPSATAEIWQEGWLNTGDIVRELADGSLVFVDRRKNIIRRSGENISALEVEAAAVGLPGIDAIVVTAVPDALRGEEVAVCAVVSAVETGTEILARQIQQRVLDRLAYFKAPGWIVFSDNLPVTASNKPRRGEIKRFATEAVASAAAHDLRAFKKRKHA